MWEKTKRKWPLQNVAKWRQKLDDARRRLTINARKNTHNAYGHARMMQPKTEKHAKTRKNTHNACGHASMMRSKTKNTLSRQNDAEHMQNARTRQNDATKATLTRTYTKRTRALTWYTQLWQNDVRKDKTQVTTSKCGKMKAKTRWCSTTVGDIFFSRKIFSPGLANNYTRV